LEPIYLEPIMRIPFISKIIQRKADSLFRKHIDNYLKNMKEQRKKDKQVVKDFSLGEPVIIIPDHTGSISLGIITGWKDENSCYESDIPIIYDAVDDKEYFILGKYISYTEQRFETLYKLAPDERFAIMYTNCTGINGEAFVTKNEGVWLDIEETRSLAKQNGFYEKAQAYWSKK